MTDCVLNWNLVTLSTCVNLLSSCCHGTNSERLHWSYVIILFFRFVIFFLLRELLEGWQISCHDSKSCHQMSLQFICMMLFLVALVSVSVTRVIYVVYAGVCEALCTFMVDFYTYPRAPSYLICPEDRMNIHGENHTKVVMCYYSNVRRYYRLMSAMCIPDVFCILLNGTVSS